jgi:Domain of unknown function (DUF5916)/Carbohydrate family 9 binding domain-like
MRRRARVTGPTILVAMGLVAHVAGRAPVAPPAPARMVIDAWSIPATAGAVKIDGDLSEPVWRQAQGAEDFRQRDPHEGAAPTHRTEVQVAFDRTSLYIAVRAFEPDPGTVVGLLTRRDDQSPSDRVSVLLDSFHDRRTAFEFGVNAAGVKYDRYWYNDTNSDDGWDAVWDVATRRTPQGWQAEFRIPFSQLRFRGGDAGPIGFAAMRTIAHLSETSTWPLLAKSASGFVSSFGELDGVERGGPQKKLEVMPFALGQVQTTPAADGNPLVDSPNPGATVGVDLKYQVAPGLTLTGTVNPDFGQVEADPAVVNLSGFETFFSERRPFFVEGSGNLSFNDLFYSRRIGRAPQGSADAPDGGFSDQPAHTTILGAAKLTGKVGRFAVGALHAVTGAENGRITGGPGLAITNVPVEPVTNYSVGRVSREFANNSRLSVMFTSTQRSLRPELSFLPRSAMVGDVDGDWRFGHGRYSLTGYWSGSTVRGSADAIDRLQTSNVHSLQRPDARTLVYDPTRTALNGDSASIGLGKISGTRTLFNVNAGYASPGFEINDLGFRSRADDIWQNAWFQVRDDVPKGHIRRRNINFNQWAGWNFDGDRRSLGGNVNSHWGFSNNWEIGGGFNGNATRFDDRRTRGGPGALVPGNMNGWVYVNTDDRRLVAFNHETDWLNDRHGSFNWYLSNGVTLRPATMWSTRISLDVSHNVDDRQWITNEDVAAATHYVFGHLDQRTVNLTIRVNYTVRPTLTIQVYGQPFVSTGAYSNFKELTNGRAPREADRYAAYAYAGTPDFRVRSFRMTNVLRWEYRPGSVLFAVWQQGRSDFADRGDLRLGRDLGATFAAPADNTFLLKISRWFDF